MRTKEYLATVRPLGRGLALETMFYADEIRPLETSALPPKSVAVSAKEVGLAKQLIESLSTSWKLDRHKDTYRDKVLALIKKKARGEEIVTEAPQEESAQILDLMEALKASLDKSDKGDGAGRRPTAKTAAEPTTAKKHPAKSNGTHGRARSHRRRTTAHAA
jgi:DNA end-binding protein Ku